MVAPSIASETGAGVIPLPPPRESFQPAPASFQPAPAKVATLHARTLERANDSLRRANRELEEFAYVAGHDLREPLRMVNIYTQLLIQECAETASEQAHQFAKHIQESVGRMEQLIQDVLQYSQVVHEEHECGVSISLRRSLDQALAVFRDRLDAAEAEIAIDHLPVILADEIQMSVVFQNLVSNSLKYAHPERKLRVRVWCKRSGDFWTIYFADNGIGFDPEFGERIFGLFKRLHGREVPGTGLGLAICRRIVERFGGSIRAQGESGAGATFIICLRGASHHASGCADIACRGQSR